MVNSIVGGQVITELSDGKCPLVVGVILIAIVSLIVALLGYKFVHYFERFSWIIMIILFCIVAGLGAKHFVNTPMGSGSGEAASVLSFGGAVFGFAVAWISLTADYNVNMSVDIPRWKVFFWTYLGLFMSLNLIEWLGAACMAATVANPAWASAYKTGSVGGLIGAVLEPVGGFGKFCLVLLAFSIVANNIPNNYSLGLSAQVLGNWAMKIPRFIWTFVGVIVYVIAAVAGRDHFATILDSFLLCMGYWLTPFFVVIFEEHLIFRRGVYNLEDWANKNALPVGIAALFSFAVGVVLAVMGMSQEWYVGPLALKAGPAPFGADIGFELGFGFTAILYPPLRFLEHRYFGR
jgi:NCS1 nucleoside transporter family